MAALRQYRNSIKQLNSIGLVSYGWVGYRITDIRLPKQTLCNITNFTRARLIDNSDITDNNMVSIPSMRKLLFKNIIEGRRKSLRFTVENRDKYLLLNTELLAIDELFGRYGIKRIQLLLRAFDDKIPLNEAAQLANISINDAQILVELAREVVAITTKRDQPRFAKLTDSKTTALSPLSVQYQSDLRLLSPLLSHAHRLRKTFESEWTWFITLCRQRLSNSRTYISFLKEEKEELQRFMGIAKELLPLKYWLMTSKETVLENTKSDEAYQDVKTQANESIKTIHIGIASKDHRSQNSKWQYSPLLRFFVHMMLITDQELAIVDD